MQHMKGILYKSLRGIQCLDKVALELWFPTEVYVIPKYTTFKAS